MIPPKVEKDALIAMAALLVLSGAAFVGLLWLLFG